MKNILKVCKEVIFPATNLIVIPLLLIWLGELYKVSLQRDEKVREEAEKVAQYMSLASKLKENSPKSDYREANRLSWELAMWLPEDVYKAIGPALVHPDKNNNAATVIISVRKVLLGKNAENLSQNDIIFHGPGIARQSGKEK